MYGVLDASSAVVEELLCIVTEFRYRGSYQNLAPFHPFALASGWGR
jgi:hypothetical protein